MSFLVLRQSWPCRRPISRCWLYKIRANRTAKCMLGGVTGFVALALYRACEDGRKAGLLVVVSGIWTSVDKGPARRFT